MICRKCNAPATLILRKEYWYCDNCFMTNTRHKFRATLGKSKTLSSNEKVLVCLSGGTSSTVLLDLIHSGISLNGTKKLRIFPYFLHILETATEDSTKKANLVIEQCKKYNFEVYVVNINEYYSTTIVLPEPNIPPGINSETDHTKLNISATINHDVMIKLKRHLFLKIANELQCNFIFIADNTTQLAKRLLSNIAIGRGSQVDNDIGFADKRDNIQILKPMRDVSDEETDHYVKIKQLTPAYDNSKKEISLQSVIDNFVLDLQENYPSTISTVCKTADKMGSLENTTNKKECTLCQSNIVLRNPRLTAVEATIFSRQMCFRRAGTEDTIELMQDSNEDKNPMFPCIYETLCYSCSRTLSELDDYKLIATVHNNAKNKNLNN